MRLASTAGFGEGWTQLGLEDLTGSKGTVFFDYEAFFFLRGPYDPKCSCPSQIFTAPLPLLCLPATPLDPTTQTTLPTHTPSFYSTERQVTTTQALRISWKTLAEFSQGGMLCAVGTQRGCCADIGHSTSPPPFRKRAEVRGPSPQPSHPGPESGGAFTSLISAPWRQQPAA